MGLRIQELELADFRNYRHFSLEGIGGLTIFVGDNAVGKTNLLEAVQLLTATTSFRNPQVSQLVREGAPSGRVRMRCGDGSRDLEVALRLEDGKKRFELNGKRKQAADLKGTVPSVTFAPDDLKLSKGSSSVRRAALDVLGTQLSKNYHVIERDYEKALRFKNRLLKEDAPTAMVDAINETLTTCGAQLHCYRYSLFKRMVPLVEKRYAGITTAGDAFFAGYRASWEHLAQGSSAAGALTDRDAARATMQRALADHAEEERIRRRSLVGPHNDKIAFFVDGRDASQFASQGQQRSIVLAWKLAEVDMVRQTLGTDPVLILDDVMSELDSARRDMLVESVGTDVQTFISATDLSPFNAALLRSAEVVRLPAGTRE